MSAADTFIFFELAGATYGLRSKDVLHLELLEHITPVPNTAAAVEGVVFSRGQVIPALNLRVRFGFPKQEHTARTRLIFLKSARRTVALIVDSAREFRTISGDSFRPIEETLTGVQGNYVEGIATLGDKVVLLLNIAAVLDLEPAAPTIHPALQPV